MEELGMNDPIFFPIRLYERQLEVKLLLKTWNQFPFTSQSISKLSSFLPLPPYPSASLPLFFSAFRLSRPPLSFHILLEKSKSF